MGNIDDILNPKASQTAVIDIDEPLPCPKCDCPVQWRPFPGCVWQCYDCDPPIDDARCREYRSPILVDREPDVWEWETNLERLPDSSNGADSDGPLVEPLLAENACPRCGRLDDFVDTFIHVGRSTRRDCKKCGRFVDFVRWREKP